MSRAFNDWLNRFRPRIASYDYYINFDNVYDNTMLYTNELNLLNSLVGSKTIEQDFISLVNSHHSCIRAIPILLAKRKLQIYCSDENGSCWYDFESGNQPVEQLCYFMEKTGIFTLLKRGLSSNLKDYVIGINVGLDLKARKNRGGHLMEDLCKRYINATGIPFESEVSTTKLAKRF